MSLNDAKIRTLKPSDKPFKVSDSHGLYLLVKPGGSRHWYLKYRINGKESRIALGAYPAVSCLIPGNSAKVFAKCWR
ncbi:uncharacterized protein DUF4102 [Raoultella ornithinolytica]|jgi:hypothetical protein|uniref:Uncharacterized protein DUF4102 n=1 Tax=Raoultella ornithinolytica TaxID=54291 RepID=A0ABD7QKE3_RAOOR|nr:uncharacterized protein DUF4102 [Raoultella ornithinolytica]